MPCKGISSGRVYHTLSRRCSMPYARFWGESGHIALWTGKKIALPLIERGRFALTSLLAAEVQGAQRPDH